MITLKSEYHIGPRRCYPGPGLSGLLLVVAAMFLGLGEPVEASSEELPTVFSAEHVLQFAEHLFSQQEYFRAISEYQRFIFLYPDSPEVERAALQIARCYFHGKRWQAAIEAVDELFCSHPQGPLELQARFLRARALTELNRSEEAREEYHSIIGSRPGDPLEAEAWYRIGLSYAREGRLLEAEESLGQIGTESWLHGKAQQVQQILADSAKTKRKDPALAGVLAAVVPGAGHLYSERAGDAALAFLVTGAFAWATVEAFDQNHEELGVGLGLLTLVFYAGNIYSAVNVAHKFNDRQERQMLKGLAPFEEVGSHQHRLPSTGLAIKIFF